jgi:hypothetical protein
MGWLALSLPVAEERRVDGDHESRPHRGQQTLRSLERQVDKNAALDATHP